MSPHPWFGRISHALSQGLLKETQAGKSKDNGANPGLAIMNVEPFISGTFEYGLGRPAAGRKVYLFINKAQDQRNLHNALVQFLGVYKTNRKARLAGLDPSADPCHDANIAGAHGRQQEVRLLTCRARAQGQLNGVSVPDTVWATPGHYSVVALLPEDHTYAKGSLFILAPGTKCVVFDMDGAQAAQACGLVCCREISSAGALSIACCPCHKTPHSCSDPLCPRLSRHLQG